MAVPNDDLMRRRFALADMGRFPTAQKNARPRTGEDPAPAPYQPINPSDPATGGVVRTRNGQMNYGFLPIGERAPFQGTWGGRSTYAPPRSPYAPPPPPATPGQPTSTVSQSPAFNRPTNAAPRVGFDLPAPIAPASLRTDVPTNANPAAGAGFGEIRARDAMLGADKPAPVSGELANRVSDERRALMSDYERVMRELVSLGARGRDTPEMQTRREVLINARKAMESRLRDLSMATPRTNVVQPANAQVARERLARTSGVDTRTPLERGISSIAGRQYPGAGYELGKGAALSGETMAFNERQAARDARQAEGARRLTTALPGGEAPLAMMERERFEMRKRDADRVALEQATAQRAIRNQTEGTPEEQLAQANAEQAKSQSRFYSTMTDIERQKALRNFDNPRSVDNMTEAAQRAAVGREAANQIAGTDEKTLVQMIDTIGIPDSPESLGAFDTNVVAAAEALARAGNPEAAARIASMAMPRVSGPLKTTAQKDAFIRGAFGPGGAAAKGMIMGATGGDAVTQARSQLADRLRALMERRTATPETR